LKFENLTGAQLQSVDNIFLIVEVSGTAACSMPTGVQLQSIDIIHSHVAVHCSDTCQIVAKWVHSLDVDSYHTYILSADRSLLIDFGRHIIGDIDDSAYIVYQQLSVICSFEEVPRVFLIPVTTSDDICDI
jgi:hypothetical protein